MTDLSTLSLHDALPIYVSRVEAGRRGRVVDLGVTVGPAAVGGGGHRQVDVLVDRPVPIVGRSEEHTSELQSHHDLVCRLLLEKKKTDAIEDEQWIIMLG